MTSQLEIPPFSPPLIKSRAHKILGSQSGTPATFITKRNGPQIQEWTDHSKAPCHTKIGELGGEPQFSYRVLKLCRRTAGLHHTIYLLVLPISKVDKAQFAHLFRRLRWEKRLWRLFSSPLTDVTSLGSLWPHLKCSVEDWIWTPVSFLFRQCNQA